jgi:hypothetical protein
MLLRRDAGLVRRRWAYPLVRSAMARPIARAVRGASGMVTTLPP